MAMAPDDKRRKNLKPVKKGQVLNPEGKNGCDWVVAMREFFEEVDGSMKDKEGKAHRRFRNVLQATYVAALRGDTMAQRLIVEQLCGRAKESVDLTSGGEGMGAAQVILYLPDDGSGDEEDPPTDEPPTDATDADNA